MTSHFWQGTSILFHNADNYVLAKYVCKISWER